MTKILVLGSVGKEKLFGGREHALAWKLSQGRDAEIYCSPGNAGTGSYRNISFNSYEDLAIALGHGREEWLVVPGPEQPLADGAVDMLQKYGIRAFGPTAEQARIETSKSHAKKLMRELEIPTPDFRFFNLGEAEKAKDYAVSTSKPLVIKEDGLAGGKGVTIARTSDEKLQAIEKHIKRGPILIEENIPSHEFSFIGFADGRNFVPLLPARDYKRLNNGDVGPNTGGMGSYAPADFINEWVRREVERDMEKVVRKTEFKGAIYGGYGVRYKKRLLYEFNCRFGDPEALVQLMMMESDLEGLMRKSIEGRLDSAEVKNRSGYAVCVVVAAPHYPENPTKGKRIFGLGNIKEDDDIRVFHSGTELMEPYPFLMTSRGRVLEITARGKNLDQASSRALENAKKISFAEGQHFRTDIGFLR